MTLARECTQALVAPTGCSEGDGRTEGSFFRNLKSKDVARVYKDDANATFGFRIKKSHWSAAESLRGFSVNCASCTCDAHCSIVLHPASQTYKHVAEIDLAALRRAIAREDVEAEYDPHEESVLGVCHYNIVSKNLPTLDLFLLIKDVLESDFAYPNGDSVPRNADDLAKAAKLTEDYRLVIKVHYEPVTKAELAEDPGSSGSR